MNELLSLGFESEYVVSHLDCELKERDDYIVLRTLANPNYYFGNLLALKVPFESKSKAQWHEAFKTEFQDMPEVEHETFTWKRSKSEHPNQVKAFTDANFQFEEIHILAMDKSEFKTPAKLNEQVSIHEICTDIDWQQWITLGIAEQKGDHAEETTRLYLSRKVTSYQQLAKLGYGQYLGAFINDRLIGYAGLYHLNNLARFQNVHVIPEYENQKIAKTLLTRLIEQSDHKVERLVIHADEHYHATHLYQSVGFKLVERECSLCWWPEKDRR